jgi:hypothetical protein
MRITAAIKASWMLQAQTAIEEAIAIGITGAFIAEQSTPSMLKTAAATRDLQDCLLLALNMSSQPVPYH